MTEAEYETALSDINRLWDSLPGTADGDRLDTLVDLVVAYECIRYPW